MTIKICLERRKAIKKRETYCFENKKIKNELTQKKEWFDPKYSLTPQFCCGAI